MQTLITKTKSAKREKTAEQVEYETMMGSLGTIGAVPALIGIWAAACFVSALMQSGGPWNMARSLFMALTGA